MMAAIGKLLAIASRESTERMQERVAIHELRLAAIERNNQFTEDRLNSAEARLDRVEGILDGK